MIGLVRQAMHTLRGSRRYALMREGITLQRLPVEELRRRQLARLVQVVQHAARTVPFYQDLFRAHGLKASEIRTFEDFACLPVLLKQDLRENLPRMLSSASNGSRRVDNATGGPPGNLSDFIRTWTCSMPCRAASCSGFPLPGGSPPT